MLEFGFQWRPWPRFGAVRRIWSSLRQLSQHEIRSLDGHWCEFAERVAVARQSRGWLELVRDQIDLIAETRWRLRRDQARRVALLRSLLNDGLRRRAPLRRA